MDSTGVALFPNLLPEAVCQCDPTDRGLSEHRRTGYSSERTQIRRRSLALSSTFCIIVNRISECARAHITRAQFSCL